MVPAVFWECDCEGLFLVCEVEQRSEGRMTGCRLGGVSQGEREVGLYGMKSDASYLDIIIPASSRSLSQSHGYGLIGVLLASALVRGKPQEIPLNHRRPSGYRYPQIVHCPLC